MFKVLKSIIFRTLNLLRLRLTRNDEGIIIGKAYPNIDCAITIKSLLKYSQPGIVYDIGANNGSWSHTLVCLSEGVKKIVFFEPQKKYVEKLSTLDLGKTDRIILPYGLSNEETQLKIKGGNASASFLDLKKGFDMVELGDDVETVPVKTLDGVVSEHNLPTPDLIKIDVQGFELKVMQGGRNILSKARFLILELSFDEFYSGQEPLSEILRFLEENQYTLIDTGFQWRQHYSPRERLLQMDGIFMNKRNVSA